MIRACCTATLTCSCCLYGQCWKEKNVVSFRLLGHVAFMLCWNIKCIVWFCFPHIPDPHDLQQMAKMQIFVYFFYIVVAHSQSNHMSIFFHLSEVGSMRKEVQEGNPDSPVLPEGSKVFLVCSGVSYPINETYLIDL